MVTGDSVAAATLVRQAAQRCGSHQPIAEALELVRLEDDTATRRAAELLSSELGIRTALDMQLLEVGGPEVEELFDSLKAAGLTVGARAKIRLLLLPPPPPKEEGAPPSSSSSWPAEPGPHARGMPMDWQHQANGSCADKGRGLQEAESPDTGMSLDTIAIVLSVLVGGAGYVLQAITARRAEHAQQEQDRGNHFAEMRRQREHEQMVAQIQRTDRWLDDCCRPIILHLQTIIIHRAGMTAELVAVLEVEHPEMVQAILAGVAPMFPTDEDGTINTQYGTTLWRPHKPALVRTYTNVLTSFSSAASVMIAATEAFLVISAPLCAVAPQPVLDLVAAEPTGVVAANYRRYISTVLVPLCRRVLDILVAHGATIEWPTKDWLREKFPELAWDLFANAYFGQHFASYTRGWDRILDEWGAGILTTVQPAFSMSAMALNQTIQWSMQRGEAKQSELIGMTAVEEVDMNAVTSWSERAGVTA
eukprot:SAG31_NODE_6703_length_1918_cov_1.219901_1_plen_477_part_00